MKFFFFFIVLSLSVFIGCDSDVKSSCSAVNGKICNNCATSGCNITCKAGEIEICVGLTYFGDEENNNLRCAFCESK